MKEDSKTANPEKNKADNSRIFPKLIEQEMKTSYLDYAMSVIIGRALPDVRDGLKPVHRRILYAMNEIGLSSSKSFKKSARIVGEVLGKYHPHGDAAVYESLVRMAQNFSMRYPLVDGQGNFGSIDGDNAAAMRYTEARLSRIAEEMLTDIERETVGFQPNFDGELKEPTVLPSRLPNLLLNGSSGIAVGMATNIPPHNLTELADGITAVIENPNLTPEELMRFIKGPDFPTGGLILGSSGIRQIFSSGRAILKLRARLDTEGKERPRIIVREIPYQVNKSHLVEEIAKLVRSKRIEGISDIRDESSSAGIRIVLELKRDASPEIVQNQLFKFSRLQVNYPVQMLAILNNLPRTLNMLEIIREYISHRVTVVERRTRFELKHAERQCHILEGLMVALKNIDEVIKVIKGSKSVKDSSESLIKRFSLSEEQVKAILEMKLQKLTSLEQEKTGKEHSELVEQIRRLKQILSSKDEIMGIIKSEMMELKAKYGDTRRTQILDTDTGDIEMESIIKEEDVAVTVSDSGYIKRMPLDFYRVQHRGGKGMIGAVTKEEDLVKEIFIANTHTTLLFVTNRGRLYWLKVFRVPEVSRYAHGKAIVNLVPLQNEERVSAIVPVSSFETGYLFFATKMGIVKKTPLHHYSRPRSTGIIALKLEGSDEVVSVLSTSGQDNLLIATQKGQAALFSESDVRPMGRNTHGVTGIRLKKDDGVIGAVIAHPEKTVLTVTENGYGKRTQVDSYRFTRRGAHGVINIKTDERNGCVVDVKAVDVDDEMMFMSRNGKVIRVPVNDISVIGRNTKGVRLMKLEQDDRIVRSAKITAGL